jgi:hypothetical protein
MKNCMNEIFKKLNFKNQTVIHAINAPESFLLVLGDMKSLAEIKTQLYDKEKVSFFIVFVTTQVEVNEYAEKIANVLEGDGLVWFSYPKGTSKKYKCDFNRDTGWEILGKLGFEGVRQVAIDEDWSSLRFRRVEYIKEMKRNEVRAMTKEGKEKLKNK